MSSINKIRYNGEEYDINCSSEDVYSTEEQIVGTWLDKTLYRKSFTGSGKDSVSHGITFSQIIKVDGCAYDGTNWLQISTHNGSAYSHLWISSSSIGFSSNAWNFPTWNVTIYYIKD